ncbi:MAG: virulence RhuM family protein [Alphaproteobacteria bacterium]|nr:virulence RhuM family protein [Alphaproteobacteria bacterium]MBU1514952.1 virulence RhuM family protein [Alphaproteobacteria bacterium]MBU2095611.1 virulence RhuM family protein [Alphaproteobacteria bacterium]MBU2149703.1 virulence RhuM family protein [Alphaproteobacteria bacterium]MBU2309072.1 virulence RhuM family protein [Alphaproteobacteria bacterium]
MSGEIILYTTEDGRSAIQLKAENGSVWLTQAEIAELFDTSVSNINKHIKGIIDEGEQPQATIEHHSIVQIEGARSVSRQIAHYSLPMILAVGFRVRSPRGAQFRRWASNSLSDYLIKGFVMDDARLKDPGADYFEELLARIRDIRSSEKQFYKKVLDIYATSVDYDPSEAASQLFFQTVQNKMHWAAHGHTAAEIVAARADADKDHMGLTAWANQSKGGLPRKGDVHIAKNYLAEEEIEPLNRIVTAYLEFAELQALARKPMGMRDWIAKLDDFLRLSDRDILTNAGRMSADVAKAKAQVEYDRWHARQLDQPSSVERHFIEATQNAKRIAATRPKGKMERE